METGERPDAPRPASVSCSVVETRREGKKGVGWKQENPLFSSPLPVLHSVKQREALFVLSLGPVSLLKMKTKFSFKRRELG